MYLLKYFTSFAGLDLLYRWVLISVSEDKVKLDVDVAPLNPHVTYMSAPRLPFYP